MALNLNTNLTALNSQSQLRQTDQAKRQILAQLASGKSINSAADNAAGLGIADSLRSQVMSDNQGMRNAYDGVSMVQTADGALSQLNDNSQRIQELAVQAGNGILNANDRAAMQKEVDQLTQDNASIIGSTQFNGQPLFNGGSNNSFQLGAAAGANAQISVNTADLTSGSSKLNSYNANPNATGTIDLSNPTAALSQIQSDMKQLSNYRSDLGASSNRFATAIDDLNNRSINSEAARSRIEDTDYAAASSQLVQQQILSQSAMAVQGQANISQQSALSLLR